MKNKLNADDDDNEKPDFPEVMTGLHEMMRAQLRYDLQVQLMIAASLIPFRIFNDVFAEQAKKAQIVGKDDIFSQKIFITT